MAHWRDGGIGNMAGGDDRPIEEWTLLEKLAEIATAPTGAAFPKCLRAPTERVGEQVQLPDGGSIGLAVNDWSVPLRAIAQEAFDEIERITAAQRLGSNAKFIEELRQRVMLGGGEGHVYEDELERLIAAMSAPVVTS